MGLIRFNTYHLYPRVYKKQSGYHIGIRIVLHYAR